MEWAYSTHECDEADRASHCSIGDNKFCPGLFQSTFKILVKRFKFQACISISIVDLLKLTS